MYDEFRALSDMLAPHRSAKTTLSKARPRPSLDATPRTSEDTDESADVPVPVLPSSTELFYFYGQNLDQCAKLSTGKPLFDLCKVHKKWLRIYAGNNFLSYLLCIFIDLILQRMYW
jgi:hypothetical protein